VELVYASVLCGDEYLLVRQASRLLQNMHHKLVTAAAAKEEQEQEKEKKRTEGKEVEVSHRSAVPAGPRAPHAATATPDPPPSPEMVEWVRILDHVVQWTQRSMSRCCITYAHIYIFLAPPPILF